MLSNLGFKEVIVFFWLNCKVGVNTHPLRRREKLFKTSADAVLYRLSSAPSNPLLGENTQHYKYRVGEKEKTTKTRGKLLHPARLHVGGLALNEIRFYIIFRAFNYFIALAHSQILCHESYIHFTFHSSLLLACWEPLMSRFTSTNSQPRYCLVASFC